jgi:uncharacterized protein YcfL
MKPNRFSLRLLLLAIVLACLAFILMSGCLSRAKKDTKTTPLDTETVVMKDLAVSSNIGLRKEWSEDINGMLQANILLRNQRNTTVNIEIQTLFFDKNGVPIQTVTDTWHPVMIQSNQDHHYKKLCPVKGAVSYQFIIKTAGK